MLSITIFLPLVVGVLILLIPRSRPRLVRPAALAGALATLACALILLVGFDPGGAPLQWRMQAPWIPALNASYDVAVDGLSLAMIVLTLVLLTAVSVYVLPQKKRQPRLHAFFFLLMTTGLIGLFASRDLLLFYLFFEIGLVPMYFIVGIWGHADRRYAAIKFFLYTRAGSLAMLLSFLALYLSADPHTFSLPQLIEAQPLAGAGPVGGLVLLGMLIGFGVKLPVVPIHNWLPDAHVEAPTEGSVMLAGVQLKMGAYGILAVMLPTLPQAAATWGWVMAALAVVALVYGALAALAQSDLKRLVAYTSINHMGYVMLGAAVWALAEDMTVRQLAVSGAAYQMVSHGLLTGGMFFMVGMLQDRADTRDIGRFGGLLGYVPVLAFLLGVLAFGSLGLPGFSGFIAEFQVIGSAVYENLWLALAAVFSLIITTGLYLKVVTGVLMGPRPENLASFGDLGIRELVTVGSLAALSFLLGIVPHFLI